jgi:hypothetical protein
MNSSRTQSLQVLITVVPIRVFAMTQNFVAAQNKLRENHSQHQEPPLNFLHWCNGPRQIWVEQIGLG